VPDNLDNLRIFMEEIWKDVIGYEGIYLISSFGRLFSKERVIKRNKKGDYIQKEKYINGTLYHGYLKTTLRKNGGKKDKFIHSLVAEAFLGIKPKNMDVCHGDGVRTNNKLENLRYGTRSDNVIDSIKHGTYYTPFITKGTQRKEAKINDEIVREIRNSNDSTYVLSKKYNVSRALISNVKRHKTWTHVN
jgi:hypothetical protein